MQRPWGRLCLARSREQQRERSGHGAGAREPGASQEGLQARWACMGSQGQPLSEEGRGELCSLWLRVGNRLKEPEAGPFPQVSRRERTAGAGAERQLMADTQEMPAGRQRRQSPTSSLFVHFVQPSAWRPRCCQVWGVDTGPGLLRGPGSRLPALSLSLGSNNGGEPTRVLVWELPRGSGGARQHDHGQRAPQTTVAAEPGDSRIRSPRGVCA